jgi:hypothetical protein
MALTIHASKDGHVTQTLRLQPQAAVSKARSLTKAGWEVYITNRQGTSYSPQMFDELLQPRDDASVATDRATLVVILDDTNETAISVEQDPLGATHAERMRSGGGQVIATALHEGAAIIDAYGDAARAPLGSDRNLRAE